MNLTLSCDLWARFKLWFTRVCVCTWLAVWRHNTVTLLAIVTSIDKFTYTRLSTFHITTLVAQMIHNMGDSAIKIAVKQQQIPGTIALRFTWTQLTQRNQTQQTTKAKRHQVALFIVLRGLQRPGKNFLWHTKANEEPRKLTNCRELFNIKCNNCKRATKWMLSPPIGGQPYLFLKKRNLILAGNLKSWV